MRPRTTTSLLAMSAIAALATPVSAGLIFFDDFSDLSNWGTEAPAEVVDCGTAAAPNTCVNLSQALRLVSEPAFLISVPGVYEIAFSMPTIQADDRFELSLVDSTGDSFFAWFFSDGDYPFTPRLTFSVFEAITIPLRIAFQHFEGGGPLLASVSFQRSVVPEPSTMLLLLIGLAGAVVARLGCRARPAALHEGS